MKFFDISNLFLNLEKTSKRILKVQFLRDFLETNKNDKDVFAVLDLISGNLQREIDKKTLGISVKTIFQVLSFLSEKNEKFIEREFNKIGDVGNLAKNLISKKKQFTLVSEEDLMFSDIIKGLLQISSIKGKDSNRKKIEIISNLFLKTKSSDEVKFLSRILIDDLRIGVSEGTIREACVNFIFPNIFEINLICQECNYVNINQKNCSKCNYVIEKNRQEEIISRYFRIVELDSQKEVSLENFFGKNNRDIFEYILRLDKNKFYIKTSKSRELYNSFQEIFEKKYNILNSFLKIFEDIKKNKLNVLNNNIILNYPIKSMLGTRQNNVEDCFKATSKPSLLDFKYDGLRVQIHNDYGKVRLFSRNLDEITKQFPEIIEFIKENFSNLSFVIDSECVGFDYENKKYLPFQVLSKRILTKEFSGVSHINVSVKAFDIMYLNGETLLKKNYLERREILTSLFIGRKLVQKVF